MSREPNAPPPSIVFITEHAMASGWPGVRSMPWVRYKALWTAPGTSAKHTRLPLGKPASGNGKFITVSDSHAPKAARARATASFGVMSPTTTR